MNERDKRVLDIIENEDGLNEIYKDECNGWFKIFDRKKFIENFISNKGNCFIANWLLYIEMKKTNPYVKLFICDLNNRQIRDECITHCFVVDGDLYYDKSQGRSIKCLFTTWLKYNKILSNEYFEGDNLKEWLKITKKYGKDYHFSIKATFKKVQIFKGSYYYAMKKVINL